MCFVAVLTLASKLVSGRVRASRQLRVACKSRRGGGAIGRSTSRPSICHDRMTPAGE